MTLLDFARGPALQWALIIMIAGMLWRFFGVLLLMRGKVLSKPRSDRTVMAGLRTILKRSWIPPVMIKRTRFQRLARQPWLGAESLMNEKQLNACWISRIGERKQSGSKRRL